MSSMKPGDLVRMKCRSSNLSHLTGLVLDIRKNFCYTGGKKTSIEELLLLWNSDDFVGPSGYFKSRLFEVVSEAK